MSPRPKSAKRAEQHVVATTAAGNWTYSSGKRPHAVFAFERTDRDERTVMVRWTDARTKKRRKRDLQLRVRDANGAIDPALVKVAESAVDEFQARVRLDKVEEPTAEEAEGQLRATVAGPKPLTLRLGFDKALHPTQGQYNSTEVRRYDQMLKFGNRLFAPGPDGEPLLKPLLLWDDFDQHEAEALGKRIADRFMASGGKEFGPAVGEDMIDAVYTVASFLRKLGPRKGGIGPHVALPANRWRKTFKAMWRQRTGRVIGKPKRPRHTPDEFHRIMAALDDPRVDKRIRLAIQLAAELRTGQVLACTRRLLRLPGDPHLDAPLPAESLGELTVPGNEKKPGETVHLTPEQRAEVDRALSTYLVRYEAAWRASFLSPKPANVIDDYPLFPGSRMTVREDGSVWTRRVRANVKPLSRDGARVAFRELESIAGVEHLTGRGWYGLRRIASDIAEGLTTDDREKDRLGGWQRSETRKEIYQDRETDELRARTAHLRRIVRGIIPAVERATQGAENAVANAIEVLLSELTDEQRAILIARLLGDANGGRNSENGSVSRASAVPEQSPSENGSGTVVPEPFASTEISTT